MAPSKTSARFALVPGHATDLETAGSCLNTLPVLGAVYAEGKNDCVGLLNVDQPAESSKVIEHQKMHGRGHQGDGKVGQLDARGLEHLFGVGKRSLKRMQISSDALHCHLLHGGDQRRPGSG